MGTEAQDFISQWKQAHEVERKAAKEYILGLAPRLRELQHRYLVVFFDGSGDSGQVEQILVTNDESALDARGWGDVLDKGTESHLPEGFAGELEEHVWALTPPGFENNEGGFGAVILDAEESKIKVNYSYRVEDSVADDYEV